MRPTPETETLVKVVVVLGILSLLIGLLYPGEDAPWTAFQSSLATPIVFPEFDNPFDENRSAVAFHVLPTRERTGTPNPPAGQTGCGTDYWNCINDFDDNTYLTLEFGVDSAVQFDVTYLGNITRVVHYVDVAFQCRGTSFDGQISLGTQNFVLTPSPGDPPDKRLRCENGTDWTQNHFTIQVVDIGGGVAGPLDSTDFWDDLASGFMTIVINDGKVDVTRVSVLVFASAQTECGTLGDWWNLGDNLQVVGCNIARFFDGFIKGVLFVINGLSWALFSLGTIIVYFATVVGSLFFGIATVLTWWLAVPGAPPVVQAIISSVFIGMIAYILYTVLILVRGTGSVGVG